MKNKNKNAFTLIELLAVIVILAIIALIATPIILGIVEDARRDSFMRSVELVINATDIDIFGKDYNDKYTYTIKDGVVSNLEVGVKNTDGMNGSITYDTKGNDTYAIHNGKYCVIKTSSMKKAEIKDYVEGECELGPTIYANGQIVYFDVDKGVGCTKEEYEKSYYEDFGDYTNSIASYNGLSGYEPQNSCLLFYAFNDEGGETINLILDHNTTGKIAWLDSNDDGSGNGPISALRVLKSATDLWKGTITPENYTFTQTESGTYTIPYKTDGYKARLITAQEIAQITGADTREGLLFDESTNQSTNRGDQFKFDEAFGDYSDSLWEQVDEGTLTENEAYELEVEYWTTHEAEYGWLYDRTSQECEDYGCYNNSESEIYGYWTGTSVAGSASNGAWEVYCNGHLGRNFVNLANYYGVRPVITVLKSNVSPGEAPAEPEGLFIED